MKLVGEKWTFQSDYTYVVSLSRQLVRVGELLKVRSAGLGGDRKGTVKMESHTI